MRWKVKLLFVYREGIEHAALEARLAAEQARLVVEGGGMLSFCRGYAVDDPKLHHVAAGAFDAAERGFDAMMEIVAPHGRVGELPDLLDGFGDRLRDLIDPTVSSALIGSEHLILPGADPLMVLIANRRLPAFSHCGFLDYWLDYHGPFARAHTPPEVGTGYRQFHTDEALTASLLQRTGFGVGDFDGAAECHYPSAEAIYLLMGQSDVVDQATEDELRFVDHDRCVTSVFAIAPGSSSHLTPTEAWASER